MSNYKRGCGAAVADAVVRAACRSVGVKFEDISCEGKDGRGTQLEADRRRTVIAIAHAWQSESGACLAAAEIARTLGVHHATVLYHVREAATPIHPRRTTKAPRGVVCLDGVQDAVDGIVRELNLPPDLLCKPFRVAQRRSQAARCSGRKCPGAATHTRQPPALAEPATAQSSGASKRRATGRAASASGRPAYAMDRPLSAVALAKRQRMEPLSRSETADLLGMTKEGVRQAEMKALEKMRKVLEKDYDG